MNEFLKSGELKLVYLISPDFGGSEGRDNQVVVTPKAYNEKQLIDEELMRNYTVFLNRENL